MQKEAELWIDNDWYYPVKIIKEQDKVFELVIVDDSNVKGGLKHLKSFEKCLLEKDGIRAMHLSKKGKIIGDQGFFVIKGDTLIYSCK